MSIRRRGFTMLELVIVVLIISISAAVAAPRYLDSLARFRSNATTKRIAAEIRMAQQQAKKSSTSQSVVFNIADNLIDIPDNLNDLPGGIKDLDHKSQDYQFRLGSADYQATLVKADFDGSTTLTFDIYGRPISGGYAIVSVGNTQQSIIVDDSGQVTISEQVEISEGESEVAAEVADAAAAAAPGP